MATHRIYIDESGDHTYRSLENLERRYLGLTGLVFGRGAYNPAIPEAVEGVKKRFLHYDPDMPPILTRTEIMKRKRAFWPLRDPAKAAQWDEELVQLVGDLPCQIFTVVIDKAEHYANYGDASWNPYSYALAVLLNRIRGWLNLRNGTADIMPEARGEREDNQLLAAYVELRTDGSTYGTGEDYRRAYPEERLLFRRKDQNVAGLQLADLLAAGQKLLTVQEAGRPIPHEVGPFAQRLNDAVGGKVNEYGRYLLV
jgi:hypothetical protein